VKTGQVTEISGADELEGFRKQHENFVGLSFPSISGSGPNGAIIHYRPSPESDRSLSLDELYLIDSGAQYKDGTTDVTRTLHFGNPTDMEKECFTRVLKGMIGLSSAVFPDKIQGHRLDTIARKALWDVGLDYAHGTGHGVGSFLNVHEGPMGISWRVYPNDTGLEEGMILSDEPGYYEDGKFGIRIESLVKIIKAEPKYAATGKKFLTFDQITLVPIQTKLILPTLLTDQETDWLNNYHQTCRDRVGALLKEMGKVEALDWLIKETQPIG
jgi:Xaa-Pro aminopeptidase